ncbi:MAG TPA: glycine--tRNA ligase subunit beta, partial [Thermodesulfobacterium geofontis]|nr:glycine--tRNA ligase subunit beta [Thermodesulfobacterium geofontis]
MSKEFFLEIGCEEIPSRFLKETAEAIANNLKNFFKEEEIEHGEIEVYYTPRRLIFYIKEVSEEQKEKTIKIKGPSKKIAFTQNGEPSPALKGFLSKHSATIEDISIEKTSQGEYVFLNKNLGRKETKHLLEEKLPQAILSIPLKKSMKWNGITFIRPIRWIVSIFGDTVVNFKIGEAKSENRTKPFLKTEKKDIVVKSFNDYKDAMKKEGIVISSDERIEIIDTSLSEMEKEFLVEIDKDKNLLYELANLTESPKIFHLVLSKEAKRIPQSIISGIIKMGARMFPGFKNGEILYVFGVQNGVNRNTEVIKNGFNRIVSAKIDDAVFFYNKDTEIPLKERIDFLKSITFETHLGSYYNKTMRLLKLTSFMGEIFNLTNEERLTLDRATLLSKADLGTLTVTEYPELHGFVGKELALESGEKDDVAQTILDHIFPRFKGDKLPYTSTGKVLGIIDRIDTLVGSFAA